MPRTHVYTHALRIKLRDRRRMEEKAARQQKAAAGRQEEASSTFLLMLFTLLMWHWHLLSYSCSKVQQFSNLPISIQLI